MRGNGILLPIRGMEEGIRYGVMEVFMRGIGKMIRRMVGVDLYMLMVIFMMEIGRKIRHMIMEFIYIMMGRSMRGIGRMISNMDMEKNSGLMELSMMESTNLEKRMGKAFSCGVITHVMKVYLKKIIFMEEENIDGLIKENILGIG